MYSHEKEFFQKQIDAFPTDARRYGWQSDDTQLIRFRQILRLIALGKSHYDIDLEELRILDVGCGGGELFGMLNSQRIGAEYVGIDAMEDNIIMAREQSEKRGINATYHHHTVSLDQQMPIEGVFDVVIESGLFATTPPTVRSIILRKLINMPKYMFVGTFLTYNRRFMTSIDQVIVPTSPEEIIREVDLRLFSFVMLGDYLPFDFAMGVYRRPGLK